jgi:hypothetical protein
MAEHFDVASSRRVAHWVWLLVLVAVPTVLMLIALMGLGLGSPVSLPVAETAPRVALGISLAGLIASLFSRRKPVIAIAVIGSLISATAYALLFWLSRE